MSAQMLSAASNISGTIADLAPGAKDGMRMLEAKAAEMAFEERPGFYIIITLPFRLNFHSCSYCFRIIEQFVRGLIKDGYEWGWVQDEWRWI